MIQKRYKQSSQTFLFTHSARGFPLQRNRIDNENRERIIRVNPQSERAQHLIHDRLKELEREADIEGRVSSIKKGERKDFSHLFNYRSSLIFFKHMERFPYDNQPPMTLYPSFGISSEHDAERHTHW